MRGVSGRPLGTVTRRDPCRPWEAGQGQRACPRARRCLGERGSARAGLSVGSEWVLSPQLRPSVRSGQSGLRDAPVGRLDPKIRVSSALSEQGTGSRCVSPKSVEYGFVGVISLNLIRAGCFPPRIWLNPGDAISDG